MTPHARLHAALRLLVAGALAASLGTALVVGQTKPPVAGQTATKPVDPADTQAKPAPPAPARELTPEQKAFADANKIPELEKKIEALRKFQTDFPNSPMMGAADSQILSALVKAVSDAMAKVREQAKKVAESSAQGSARGGGASGVAKQMKVQIALVEERVRYTGENGVRFHPMVVRSLARQDKDTQGFVLKPGQSLTVRHTFDLDKVVAEAKAHLDDFEVNNTRFGQFGSWRRSTPSTATPCRWWRSYKTRRPSRSCRRPR